MSSEGQLSDLGDVGWPPIDPRLIPKIVDLIGPALGAAYTTQRAVEIVSGIESKTSANNIIDAFAHLHKLFLKASTIPYEEQLAEVYAISDHLTRAILEAPEEVLTWILGDIEKIWDEYVTTAIPLIATEHFSDSEMPSIEWMTKRRAEWSKLMSRTRERKNGPSLAEAIIGADEFSVMIEEALLIRDRLRGGLALARLRTHQAEDQEHRPPSG